MEGFDGGYYAVRLVEEIHPDGKATWFAEHPELPGCNAVGDDQGEALASLDKSREAWLKWAQAHAVEAPKAEEHPCVLVQYADRPEAAPAEQAGGDLGVQQKQTIRVAA